MWLHVDAAYAGSAFVCPEFRKWMRGRLKYYFESPLIYKCHFYRQTIFNQLNIMVPHVDIIGL